MVYGHCNLSQMELEHVRNQKITRRHLYQFLGSVLFNLGTAYCTNGLQDSCEAPGTWLQLELTGWRLVQNRIHTENRWLKTSKGLQGANCLVALALQFWPIPQHIGGIPTIIVLYNTYVIISSSVHFGVPFLGVFIILGIQDASLIMECCICPQAKDHLW